MGGSKPQPPVMVPASEHPLGGFQGDGEGIKPREGEASFAEGRQASHRWAVEYQGAWETEFDGTCRAVRLHARALHEAGVPVLLQSFNRTLINLQGFPEPAHGNISKEVLAEVGEIVNTSATNLCPRIKHLVVRDGQHLRQAIMPRYLNTDTVADAEKLMAARDLVYRTTVAMTVWERESIDPEIARQLSRCAQAWVPCSQNRDALIRSGVPEDQVHVVPHPFDPKSTICRMTERSPMPDEKRFYSITGAWQPRKAFDRILEAFLLAFKPTDRARLALKYVGGDWNWPGYVGPKECLKQLLAREDISGRGWTFESLGGHLKMIDARLRPEQLMEVHFYNNIYVSAAHGEAFALPAYDAKLAGNAMVHVPYGGTADFCDPERDEPVPYFMGPAHESYRWEPDAQWADYQVQCLATSMQQVEAPKTYARPKRVDEEFTVAAVGKRMRELLLEVAKAVPEAERYLRERSGAGE